MLILKSILYRITRIAILLIIALIMTGSVQLAISISILDAVVATIYYYYFDIVWDKYKDKIKKAFLIIKYRF